MLLNKKIKYFSSFVAEFSYRLNNLMLFFSYDVNNKSAFMTYWSLIGCWNTFDIPFLFC